MNVGIEHEKHSFGNNSLLPCKLTCFHQLKTFEWIKTLLILGSLNLNSHCNIAMYKKLFFNFLVTKISHKDKKIEAWKKLNKPMTLLLKLFANIVELSLAKESRNKVTISILFQINWFVILRDYKDSLRNHFKVIEEIVSFTL